MSQLHRMAVDCPACGISAATQLAELSFDDTVGPPMLECQVCRLQMLGAAITCRGIELDGGAAIKRAITIRPEVLLLGTPLLIPVGHRA